MKKLNYLFIGIFIVSTVLVNCARENALPESAIYQEEIDVKKIAQEHNQTLDFVLRTLKKKDLSKVDDIEKMIIILDEGIESYFTTTLENENLVRRAVELSNQQIAKYLNSSDKISSKINDASPISLVIEENESHFSDKQIYLLQQCDQVLSDFNGNNIESVTNSFEEIKNIAQSELSEESAQVILIACEVGKMSSTYWSENIEEWNQVLNGGASSGKANGWFSWSEVAGADVAGAVGAAVTTAVINAIPGGGQVAYGTAIVSTAAGASVGDAVLQVWNHYF